jgi:hypothetical protein
MRYSLSQLLFVTFCIAAALALVMQLGALGVLLVTGAAGVGIGLYGLIGVRVPYLIAGAAIILVVVGVLYVDVSGQRMWDGEFTLTFDINIVDHSSRDPIPNAQVSVGTRALAAGTYSVDQQGNVHFSQAFPCGGTDSAMGITRSSWTAIPLSRYCLTVRTDDGREHQYPLDQVVGQSKWPIDDPALPAITLEIKSP